MTQGAPLVGAPCPARQKGKVGMSKLDFSRWVPDEPVELTSFKRKVIQVALDHSSRYHCGDVSEVLEPLGIDDSLQEAMVTFTVVGGFTFSVEVDPTEMALMDEETQKSHLLDLLRRNLGNGEESSLRSFDTDAAEITSMQIGDTPRIARRMDDYWWRYGSTDGRVLHAFYENLDQITRSYVNAVCGMSAYPTPWSYRAQDRRCSRCVRALEVAGIQD